MALVDLEDEVMKNLLRNPKGAMLVLTAIRDIDLDTNTQFCEVGSWGKSAKRIIACLDLNESCKSITIARLAMQACETLGKNRPSVVHGDDHHAMRFHPERYWLHETFCDECMQSIDEKSYRGFHCLICDNDTCLSCAEHQCSPWTASNEKHELVKRILLTIGQWSIDGELCRAACTALVWLDEYQTSPDVSHIFNLISCNEKHDTCLLTVNGVQSLWGFRDFITGELAIFACRTLCNVLATGDSDPRLCLVVMDILGHILSKPSNWSAIHEVAYADESTHDIIINCSLVDMILARITHSLQLYSEEEELSETNTRVMIATMGILCLISRESASVKFLISLGLFEKLGSILLNRASDEHICLPIATLFDLMLVLEEDCAESIVYLFDSVLIGELMIAVLRKCGWKRKDVFLTVTDCIRKLMRLNAERLNNLNVMGEYAAIMTKEEVDPAVLEHCCKAVVEFQETLQHLPPSAGMSSVLFVALRESEDDATITKAMLSSLLAITSEPDYNKALFWAPTSDGWQSQGSLLLKLFIEHEDLEILTAVTHLLCLYASDKDKLYVQQNFCPTSIDRLKRLLDLHEQTKVVPLLACLVVGTGEAESRLQALMRDHLVVPALASGKIFADEISSNIQALVYLAPSSHNFDEQTAQAITMKSIDLLKILNDITDHQDFLSYEDDINSLCLLMLRIIRSHGRMVLRSGVTRVVSVTSHNLRGRQQSASHTLCEALDTSLKRNQMEPQQNPTCTVCLDRVVNVVSTTCFHTFCSDCAEALKSGSGTCPNCRGPLMAYRQFYF
jgi:hypothetical protein